MSHSSDLSRRRALQLFSGMPLLPLASSMATLSFATEAVAHGQSVSYTFGGMAAPSLDNPAQMATTSVESTLTLRVGPESKTYPLGYETFFLTGRMVTDARGGATLAGGYYDINNQPIVDDSTGAPRQFFSDSPDGMSLLSLSRRERDDEDRRLGRRGSNRVYAVVQFEYTTQDLAGNSRYGRLPSPIAVLSLDQDRRTGQLSLVKYHNVDTSGVNGLWITCGASLSPWGTHLSSEEYEPDATTIAANDQFKAFSTALYGDPLAAKPYHYGHLPEVTVHPDGTGTVKKHYCLGRISHELVQVMPDERTVLMGDDFDNGGLFMFVADKKRDLSAGSLYVAKWTLTSTAKGGAGTLSWIHLGHATSSGIEALAGTLQSSDILDVKTSDPSDADYTPIAYSGKTNWVKFVPGQELAAAFLETHRFAACVGGSMVFTKMEGTTVNARDKVAYSAMSAIRRVMVDAAGLDEIIESGAVYAMNLRGRQYDSSGARIKSQWVPVDLGALPELTGEDIAADALGNTSAVDKIANPDNLKFSEKLRTLFIGEDSGRHVNNFLWAYNVDTRQLARILSCPAAAESTGLQAADDVNGFTYVMSNFQHAGDFGAGTAEVKATLKPLIDANYNGGYSAAVGYLTTGLPVIDDDDRHGR